MYNWRQVLIILMGALRRELFVFMGDGVDSVRALARAFIYFFWEVSSSLDPYWGNGTCYRSGLFRELLIFF